MKLIICAKFHVNRMNGVESRRGVRLNPLPSSVCVTIFSSRLLVFLDVLSYFLNFLFFRNIDVKVGIIKIIHKPYLFTFSFET